MKSPIFRTAAAFALAALLAACGGSPSDQEGLTAASMQTGVATTAVAGGVSAALATSPATPSANTSAPTVIAANSPAPDCAADGCSSLRIIDGNAEAWRYDAMRRADAPQT
jgi:hypothetical protein